MAETITGELRHWGKVTLDFRGPTVSETAANNPFANYRLDVTFRSEATGETLVVPGFFAADGNAAESHATAGDVWRVNFAPPAEGAWSYTASFRAGANVAAADNPLSGASAGFFDGASGSFTIAANDAGGAGFRSRGALQYAGDNHYRFAETGEPFLKGGAGSPENFLAYSGFDNTKPTHSYAPHVGDWASGDPTWDGGDGKGIIGAVNYLAAAGMNAVYVLTMNIGGDGDDVSPWITNDAANVTRYDVSKLAQWEVLFEHMSEKGVMMHLITQETENDQLLDGGALGDARKIYYRELIARFGDNPGLQWNLGEENSNTDAQRKAFADYIKSVDPYDHPIVVHTFPGAQETVYGPLLGDPQLDGVSLQTNATHAMTITWIDQSNAAGHPWVVSLDEIGPADVGAPPDANDPSHDAIRSQHLWGNLMAGGAGVQWYFGYSLPNNDLNLEDFRSRAEVWRQTDIALDFFNDHLPFEEMSHADELTPAPSDYVLAKPGSVYAIYLPNGGDATLLDLSGQSGRYEVKWYDPRNGGALQDGAIASVAGGAPVSLGVAPHDAGQDWAILVRRLDGPPPDSPPTPPSPSEGSAIVLDGATALTGSLGAQNWGAAEVSALSWTNEPVPVTKTSDGLGVEGGRFAGQIDHNRAAGGSETLRLDVADAVDAATIRLGRMFPTENGSSGPEMGAWTAYDASGALVDEGVFDARQGTPAGTNVYDFRIDPPEDFTRLDLSARPYANATGTADGDSSDYSLLRISFDFAALNSATIFETFS